MAEMAVRVDEAGDDRLARDVDARRPGGHLQRRRGPIRSMRPLLTRTVAFAIGAAPVPSITRAPTRATVPTAADC